MPKLKRCPFCGSTAEIIDDGGYWTIRCTECDGQVHYAETLADAVFNWNRRDRAMLIISLLRRIFTKKT